MNLYWELITFLTAINIMKLKYLEALFLLDLKMVGRHCLCMDHYSIISSIQMKEIDNFISTINIRISLLVMAIIEVICTHIFNEFPFSK